MKCDTVRAFPNLLRVLKKFFASLWSFTLQFSGLQCLAVWLLGTYCISSVKMAPAHYAEMSVHSDLKGMSQNSSKLTYDCAYMSVCVCPYSFRIGLPQIRSHYCSLSFATTSLVMLRRFVFMLRFFQLTPGMAEQGQVLFIWISK